MTIEKRIDPTTEPKRPEKLQRIVDYALRTLGDSKLKKERPYELSSSGPYPDY